MNSNEILENEKHLGYGQILAIIWHRRLWFLIVICSVLSISIPLVLNQKPTYQSSFRLLVEPNYENEKQVDPFTDNSVGIDYATQLQLMSSSELIQKAINKLKDEYPTLTVKEIKKFLNLNQVLGQKKETFTKIFEAVYIADDPVKTQKVLDAIKIVYQEYNLDQQKKRLSDGLSFIESELQSARNNLLIAEKSLEEFRTKNNIIEPEPEAANVSDILRKIELERVNLKAEYTEAQTRYHSFQKDLNYTFDHKLTETRLSQSSRYQNLLNEIQKIEVNLEQERLKFTDANPLIQDLSKQKQKMLILLQQEAERTLGNLPNDLEQEQDFLKTGQMGVIDQDMTVKLLETEKNLLALEARDQTLAKTEKKLNERLKSFPELIAQYNILKQEVEVKRATLQLLLEGKQKLGIELNRGGYNWQVVEPPLLGIQISPNIVKDFLLSGVVAVFLAGIAAFLAEAVDEAIRTSEQLKGQGTSPLLGVIPRWQMLSPAGVFQNWPRHLSSDHESSVVEMIQWQPFRESLDLICKNLQLRNSSASLKSLVITSALEGEGKTTLTLGLAFSASRLHYKVLVIDANLRHPTFHKLFGLPNEKGLSSLIASETETPHINIISLWGETINIMTAGPEAEDPVKLLGSQRLWRLFREFEQKYDLVLLDTSAILGIVDAIQVASHARGIVMVGCLDKVTQSAFTRAVESLNKLNLIGIVANGARETKDCQYLSFSQEISRSQDAA